MTDTLGTRSPRMTHPIRVMSIVGARPNFMKIAPIVTQLRNAVSGFQSLLVHTGQHYDERLSNVFFDELGIPHPDVNLNVGSGSRPQQTAAIIAALEPVLLEYSSSARAGTRRAGTLWRDPPYLRSAHAASPQQRGRSRHVRATDRSNRRHQPRGAVHLSCPPRTRPMLDRSQTARAWVNAGGLRPIDPLGYVDFLGLMEASRVLLTDSGGIQEETTIPGVPCLTLRDNTERPVTITHGTNRRVGSDPAKIAEAWQAVRNASASQKVPPLWDGQTAQRSVEVLRES